MTLFTVYFFFLMCVCFGVQVHSFCTRLSPVCSLLHFMVPAYSESVYATDVLRLCESAFSHPLPQVLLCLKVMMSLTRLPPPPPESRRVTEERDELDWRDG